MSSLGSAGSSAAAPWQTRSRTPTSAHLGDDTLQGLPDVPRFVINATNLQSSQVLGDSRSRICGTGVSKIENPTERLAVAVAASSASPLFPRRSS